VAVEDQHPYRAHFAGPPYALCAVTVRGPAHVRKQTRCQDVNRCIVLEDGTVIAAVADGLGSQPNSDLGAFLATDAAVVSIERGLAEPDADPRASEALMMTALADAHDRLQRYADESQLALASLACTLLVALIRGRTVMTAHVGDGAIFSFDARGWSVLSEPEETVYVNNVTPLTSPMWQQASRICKRVGVESVCLISDGIQRSCIRRSNGEYQVNNEGFFGPTYEAVVKAATVADATRLVANMLGGPSMSSVCDDDKTLVMIWGVSSNERPI
jgi:hypothetical protein